ncbi:hypothetical protein H8356DRAFT_1432854 [Neocallimastix lanati (nom. inval.)]|nr:hypothetical protein H8356DRAFT_1432854 [Neocallimastix sp. JGI-2020a]
MITSIGRVNGSYSDSLGMLMLGDTAPDRCIRRYVSISHFTVISVIVMMGDGYSLCLRNKQAKPFFYNKVSQHNQELEKSYNEVIQRFTILEEMINNLNQIYGPKVDLFKDLLFQSNILRWLKGLLNSGVLSDNLNNVQFFDVTPEHLKVRLLSDVISFNKDEYQKQYDEEETAQTFTEDDLELEAILVQTEMIYKTHPIKF